MKQHRYLTVEELSDYLQIHKSTIYRLLKEGKLPGFRVGSDWRFNIEEIERFAAQSNVAQPRRSQS